MQIGQMSSFVDTTCKEGVGGKTLGNLGKFGNKKQREKQRRGSKGGG